ncbi:MAG: hypothetical protein ABIM98_01410 [candidate division WOR-3 bacterium]
MQEHFLVDTPFNLIKPEKFNIVMLFYILFKGLLLLEFEKNNFIVLK